MEQVGAKIGSITMMGVSDHGLRVHIVSACAHRLEYGFVYALNASFTIVVLLRGPLGWREGQKDRERRTGSPKRCTLLTVRKSVARRATNFYMLRSISVGALKLKPSYW